MTMKSAEREPLSQSKSPPRVTVARRRLFSTAHFYAQRLFSEEDNRRHFGACFTPYGHGHNYVLEAFVEGPILAETGLVLNLTDLDRVLASVVAPLDHHHVNFDVPEFRLAGDGASIKGPLVEDRSVTEPSPNLVPTTENLLLYCRTRLLSELRRLSPALTLKRLRLFETDDLWVELDETPLKAHGQELTHEVTLQAVHQLCLASLSAKQNEALYGKCFRPHGHDYRVRVTVRAPLDARSGLSLQREELARILDEVIVQPLSGTDLNQRFANTSGESLAYEFYELLKTRFAPGQLVKLAVRETAKNLFEYAAP
jgi:6-pyruvoyltetrahydropterin/6-carboxytetrahydropterin synthase